jgi:hypothetical protein
MSEKPISVGDLVMVVRPTVCGHGCGMGLVFMVQRIDGAHPGDCGECDKYLGVLNWAASSGGRNYDIARLKRLPSIEELESTEETLKEPA